MSSILEKDKAFVWHPFTHLKHAERPVNIVRSEGLYFIDENGNRIMDAIASWWVNLHGHCHPYISKKVSAGFVFEPLVQGAAGMFMYDAALLDKLISFFREHKALIIADEVMTGFGRTGTFFAANQLQNKPDIICLSKGLTGGYMPLGVTACSNEIH